MKCFWMTFFIVFALNSYAANIEQNTKGWCSPAVADNKGKITIVCYGEDPKTLNRLHELLEIKDLELQKANKTIKEKEHEVEEWSLKYMEIAHQIKEIEEKQHESEVAAKARKLLYEGKLNEAKSVIKVQGGKIRVIGGKIKVHRINGESKVEEKGIEAPAKKRDTSIPSKE